VIRTRSTSPRSFLVLIFVGVMELVVNVNYRGKLKNPIDLKKINVPNSKYYTLPHQLVIKDEKGTLIFFSSGKFRIMGCIDELEATFLAYKYIEKISSDDYPEISVQSHTSVAKLGRRVDLIKLSNHKSNIYNPELFAAVRVTKYDPISVNVFSTGSVVVCGLKEPDYIHDIVNDLLFLINS
jgi:TATA-box binding protein (TBP) (component of TFIID and TFIIIB)